MRDPYLFAEYQAFTQNPGRLDQVPGLWIVHGEVNLLRRLLKSRHDLLKLCMRSRVIASWRMLAKIGEEERILADALDWL